MLLQSGYTNTVSIMFNLKFPYSQNHRQQYVHVNNLLPPSWSASRWD